MKKDLRAGFAQVDKAYAYAKVDTRLTSAKAFHQRTDRGNTSGKGTLLCDRRCGSGVGLY